MANEKMTQRDWFNKVIAMAKGEPVSDEDKAGLVAFAEGRITVLDNKTANRKSAKDKDENVALMARIREVLTAEGKTVTEIVGLMNEPGLSTAKVTAMLKVMKAEGTVVNTADKKKSLYALA